MPDVDDLERAVMETAVADLGPVAVTAWVAAAEVVGADGERWLVCYSRGADGRPLPSWTARGILAEAQDLVCCEPEGVADDGDA